MCICRSASSEFFICRSSLRIGISATGAKLIDDISVIQKYWASLRPYSEFRENHFGVKSTGLPVGCQVEQVQIVHRHAIRFPATEESLITKGFSDKVMAKSSEESFTGELSFLNTWTPRLGLNSLLLPGVSMEHASGSNFWVKYGRLLYNAAPGQVGYNAANQTKPLLRAHTQPRVLDSARAWAEGFFGQYNATDKYSLLQLPYTTGANNTLAAFFSCRNFMNLSSSLFKSQPIMGEQASLYLVDAVERLSKNMPKSINLTEENVFGMQILCAHEHNSLGSSDFCKLFTLEEWKGFQFAYAIYFYEGSSFGSVAGRALGIGLLTEILARLEGKYIYASNSSINSTLSSNPSTFPLDQKFYLDMTNDLTILALLASMSLDYFRQPAVQFPLQNHEYLRASEITPYAARLVIEKIGCKSKVPRARSQSVTQYTNSQYNYSMEDAVHKFVRMRLNNGILPLKTIRGGACNLPRRPDGLCPLKNFLRSQKDAAKLANFQFLCFGDYNVDEMNFDGDGTYFP